ncbi:FimV/HubP family polar landmark protein [Thiolinea disciformis]|uniref:FimV/HubP family polar landmark protein n=1 Tax=Thiolinea disciformis TaxID=125614 RepID=UPI0003A183BB|nr:FimV/HubP family polar landmark protein [Thiolinea disciformis]
MMKQITKISPLMLATGLLALLASSSSLAEGTTIQVQPKDTLGSIVSKHYPNHPKRKALMRYLLETNPTAFKENNFHQLIVGKELKLPTLDSLPSELQYNAEAKTPEPAKPTAPTSTQETADTQLKVESPTATRIAELEAQLKALQTQVSEPPPAATTSGDDVEFLKQQLDQIEAANEELLAENKKLKQTQEQSTTPNTTTESNTPTVDADALAQQLDSIEAANEELLTENKKLKEQLAAGKPAEGGDDVAFLKKQFEDISATNEQILAEKKTLEDQLQTAQQQAASVPTLQNQLDTTNKDLLLVRAALANAELSRSQQTSGAPWWLWGASLILIPLAWWLGRKPYVQPLATPSPIPKANNPKPPSLAPQETAQAALATRSLEQEAVFKTADQSTLADMQLAAANDDNPEAAIKLDMVRAYLDLRDASAAQPLLREILEEGGMRQQQEAREILSFLS